MKSNDNTIYMLLGVMICSVLFYGVILLGFYLGITAIIHAI